MNNSQAIVGLQELYGVVSPNKQIAIDMAIKAIQLVDMVTNEINSTLKEGLKEEEIIDDELDYLAEAIDHEWANAMDHDDHYSQLAKWLEELLEYKALGKVDDLVSREEILQARPENLNPSMYDDLLSAEHEGWNNCNKEWYNLIKDFRR